MKSNKGITLISLIMYIIVLSVVIGTMSLLSGFFYKNANEITIASNEPQEFIRFIMYLTEDLNSR